MITDEMSTTLLHDISLDLQSATLRRCEGLVYMPVDQADGNMKLWNVLLMTSSGIAERKHQKVMIRMLSYAPCTLGSRSRGQRPQEAASFSHAPDLGKWASTS